MPAWIRRPPLRTADAMAIGIGNASQGEVEAALLAARESEAMLREKGERLHAALEASGTGTFRWELDSDALFWDDNLDRLFGLRPDESVRNLSAFIDRVHPEDRGPVMEMCARCATEGIDFDREFRVVWPDGSVHWLSE